MTGENNFWKVIKFTHKAPVTEAPDSEDQTVAGIESGWYIPRQCQSPDTKELIRQSCINPNSTFYRDWEVMEREEADRTRIIRQIGHYIGAFVFNETWIPEEGMSHDPATEECTRQYLQEGSIKVMYPVSEEEMISVLTGLFSKNAAIPGDVVEAGCRWLAAHKVFTSREIDALENKEARGWLYLMSNIWPESGDEILRILLMAGGWNMLIKSKEIIESLSMGCTASGDNMLWKKLAGLGDAQCAALSRCFRRHKKLLLALKKGAKAIFGYIQKDKETYSSKWGREMASTYPGWKERMEERINSDIMYIGIIGKINYISRLSRKNHVPQKKGFWQSILAPGSGLREAQQVSERLNELTGMKIISLLGAVNHKMLIPSEESKIDIYTVRNQKLWLRGRSSELSWVWGPDYEYLCVLKEILEGELIRRLKEKVKEYKYVYFDPNINIKCPTSAKNFVGSLPAGSWIDMRKDANTLIGLYWRGEWGAQDIDLSFIDDGGRKVGWNSDWMNEGVSFSGDMVRAVPEASEVLWFRKGVMKNGLVYSNMYNGRPDSEFNFFVAQSKGDPKEFGRGYMVEPGSVILSERCRSASRSGMVGLVWNWRLMLCSWGIGSSQVSSSLWTDAWMRGLRDKLSCIPDLKDVILKTGLKEKKKVSERIRDKTLMLDAPALSPEYLIKLFD